MPAIHEEEMESEEFRDAAARQGLALTSEEAREALAGVNRWRRNAQQARQVVTSDLEPAPIFRAPAGGESR